ncbi:MAG: hypothetical protein IT340_03200 [Chloroflexi bacterium]|nr:hypothetical protein [Chloroflexota bacterium]
MARIVPITTGGGKRLVASWSSGKEIVGEDAIFRGWFLDVGIDPALDEAAAAAGWPQGRLLHLDGESREHWLLPSPTVLFVLIDGIPYGRLSALASNDVAYAGVGCSWIRGQRSRLGVMALARDLLTQGYETPLPFTVSSTSTDDLLAALLRHNEVLDALEAAARAAGKPREFDFHGIGLPLVPGPKVARGAGPLTTQISPVTCAHPQELTREALRGIVTPAIGLLAPPPVAEIKTRRWSEIVEWAAEFKRAALRPAEDEALALAADR